MTKRRSNAVRFARTKQSVQISPFRRGSAREKAFFFLLEKKRTLFEFHTWAKRIGADGRNLLRMFRNRSYPIFLEENGKITIRL
jgi:hypothetical protein